MLTLASEAVASVAPGAGRADAAGGVGGAGGRLDVDRAGHVGVDAADVRVAADLGERPAEAARGRAGDLAVGQAEVAVEARRAARRGDRVVEVRARPVPGDGVAGLDREGRGPEGGVGEGDGAV